MDLRSTWALAPKTVAKNGGGEELGAVSMDCSFRKEGKGDAGGDGRDGRWWEMDVG